jgi:hypothetical protein
MPVRRWGAARDLMCQARGEACAPRRRTAAVSNSCNSTSPHGASVRAVRGCTVAADKPFDDHYKRRVMACRGQNVGWFRAQFAESPGHFVFVNKLVPLLKSGADHQPVIAGHRFADVTLEDPTEAPGTSRSFVRSFEDGEHSFRSAWIGA